MNFTVDRSKWRYGGSKYEAWDGHTMLVNQQGLMCCLGFGCLASGITCKEMLGCSMPSSIHSYSDGLISYEHKIHWLRMIEEVASCVNDDCGISDENRESRLKSLFKCHGHEIEFVGEYRTHTSLLKHVESQPAQSQIMELRA